MNLEKDIMEWKRNQKTNAYQYISMDEKGEKI